MEGALVCFVALTATFLLDKRKQWNWCWPTGGWTGKKRLEEEKANVLPAGIVGQPGEETQMEKRLKNIKEDRQEEEADNEPEER